MSESLANLSAALVAASAEMPAVGFDQNNPFIGSRFASLGAVISAARPILAKHSLAIMQFACSDAQGRVGVRTRLIHSSGEYLEESIYMEIFEDKDSRKSKAQVAGSIITYLRRYAQSALLNLYSDEDADGNASSLAPAGVPTHSVSKAPSTPTRPPKAAGAAPGEAKGSASPTPESPEKKALACKARFLQVIAEKKWEFYAWLHAVRNGWILDTERLEDGSPSKFPVTSGDYAKSEEGIKKLMDEATRNNGPSQEEQEAYDKAHLPDDFGPSETSDTDDNDWKYIPIPTWSKHFKEGLKTFGDLEDKQLWWWAVKWKPAGYNGKPPKKEDIELRRMLDGVRSLKNFTE